MFIDLQLHSTYSDGRLTPTELADFIAKYGIKVASLTDHNTVAGLAEFRQACRSKGIMAIPGIELYVKLNHRHFNILWFNFNEDNPELHQMLRNTQIRRLNKARKVLETLRLSGFCLETDKILAKYNHYASLNSLVSDLLAVPANRRRISRELGQKIPREHDVIKHYFTNKRIGVLRNSLISFDRIVALRRKIGGQLVLNHPGKYGFLAMPVMKKLKKMGLDGIEVLSPHHSIGAVLYAQYLAEELGLIMTGGSDFHYPEGYGRPLQESWQYFKIDSKHLKGVEKIIS